MKKLAKDSRKMRREGNKGRKTVRKVFRNMIIKERYENMKKDLDCMKDPTIFKTIKELEGRRAIPRITKTDRHKVFEHDEISDLIAEQLNPSKEKTTENE